VYVYVCARALIFLTFVESEDLARLEDDPMCSDVHPPMEIEGTTCIRFSRHFRPRFRLREAKVRFFFGCDERKVLLRIVYIVARFSFLENIFISRWFFFIMSHPLGICLNCFRARYLDR